MRHNIDRRKLGRDSAHRRAMMANLACSLIQHERIETTITRAKEVRRLAEKMITKGKKGNVADRRVVAGYLRQPGVVKKVFDELAPRFSSRQGGYTRILRKSTRRYGDAAEMAYIEFVDYKLPSQTDSEEKKAKRKEKKEARDLEKQAAGATPGTESKKSTKDSGTAKKTATKAAGAPQKSAVRKTAKV